MAKNDRPDENKYLELLGVHSKNFMGSGLSFEQFWKTDEAIRYQRSWTTQCTPVRISRREIVFELADMRSEHIKQWGIYGCMAYDITLEAVIEGDAEKIEEAMKWWCGEADERNGDPKDGRWDKLEALCRVILRWFVYEKEKTSEWRCTGTAEIKHWREWRRSECA